MSKVHVVKQGECLSLIALRHGFADWRAVYDHPDNAELKQKRPNPNVLKPGDRVVIPDRKVKTLELATGKTHKLRVARPQRHVRVALMDTEGRALAGKPYVLEVDDGTAHEGSTDGEGMVNEAVSFSATAATLTCGELVWHLKLGHLDPLQTAADGDLSGVQARLHNLGYDVSLEGALDMATRKALRAFQCDHGLEPTGRCDDDTLKKLEEAHGS